MKLYDLMNSMTLQGNIEVRHILCNGDTRESKYFESQDDLASADLEDMEDLEVAYMYAETFEQKNWTYTRTRPLMVIEVQKGDY